MLPKRAWYSNILRNLKSQASSKCPLNVYNWLAPLICISCLISFNPVNKVHESQFVDEEIK